MPNKWTEHVHSFAKKHGMTYMCAMTDPACSADYKANKPKKPLTRAQEREHMGLEDFDYKPASSPENRFRMSVAQRKAGEKKEKKLRVLRAIKEKALEKKVELMEEAHNREGMDIEDLKSLLLRRSRGEVLPVAVNTGAPAAPAEPAKKRRGRPQKYATPEEARRAKIRNTIEAQKRRKLEGRGSQLEELASSRGYIPVGTSAMSFSRASGGELSGKIPKKNELIMRGSGFTTDIARRLYDWWRPAGSFEEWRARQQSRGMSDAKAEELLAHASADARLRDAEHRLAEAKSGSKKQKDAAKIIKERKEAIARERGVFQGDVDHPVDWAEARAAVPPAAIGDWEVIDGKGRKRKEVGSGTCSSADRVTPANVEIVRRPSPPLVPATFIEHVDEPIIPKGKKTKAHWEQHFNNCDEIRKGERAVQVKGRGRKGGELSGKIPMKNELIMRGGLTNEEIKKLIAERAAAYEEQKLSGVIAAEAKADGEKRKAEYEKRKAREAAEYEKRKAAAKAEKAAAKAAASSSSSSSAPAPAKKAPAKKAPSKKRKQEDSDSDIGTISGSDTEFDRRVKRMRKDDPDDDDLDREDISHELALFGDGRPEQSYPDWEHMKWGSFTKQFKHFRTLNPHSRVTDLKDFADVIVAHPDHFHKRTVKRARFYINVINKKK